MLPGFEHVAAEREAAKASAQGEQLTAQLRQPLRSIDSLTREVEQHSPLFRETDANTLGRGLF